MFPEAAGWCCPYALNDLGDSGRLVEDRDNDCQGARIFASAARCITASMPSKAGRMASKLPTSAVLIEMSEACSAGTRSSPEEVYLSRRVRVTTPPIRPLDPVTRTFSWRVGTDSSGDYQPTVAIVGLPE